MFSATSGTITVDGYNIETDLNKIRSSLGLCPQHEIQFQDLTVLEHLMFFAMVLIYSFLPQSQYINLLSISLRAKLE